MSTLNADRLRGVPTFENLVRYLHDQLEWPISADNFDNLTFDYEPEELGINAEVAVKVADIKQLRPLVPEQPWGVFFLKFAPNRLPTVVLRRILRAFVKHKRQEGSAAHRPTWEMENLLFICAHRQEEQDALTFVHFAQPPVEGRAARLTSFGWTQDAHNRTVLEFNLPPLRWPDDTTQVAAWRNQWLGAFDVEKVTKQFFREIANWYFWALKHVCFPKDAPKEADGHDHVSVIRLITRLIFCWFVKEKGLIPGALFDERELARGLDGFSPDKESAGHSVFYRAILQNLFFATLNTEMAKRGWAREEQNFMAHSLYRHKECFRNLGVALDLFKNIPFLNGGLFECLDKDLGENASPRYVRVDGFSRRHDSQPTVPDFLFFGAEREVDLSADYGVAKFKRATVRGLIHTFNHYRFTIMENTPLDQEVALDPELSGKVFENLLAAYNPQTGATARKQTGSFYTPREIVGYMVDEGLIAYLETKLETAQASAKDIEPRLRQLFAYNDEPHQFTAPEVDALIAAIDGLKALDPAVGSGAFPMDILHKLVFILGKLDPRNEKWKERQVQRVRDAITTAERIEDAALRERTVSELGQQIAGVNEAFERNELDYGRKLYLIENCIYGVDIQSIAVQIAKMRFFISLIVDQKTDPRAPNLGVRPLPNLETKFVAANTLIGVNRPGQQLLRNQKIDAKGAELRRVRERHFNARTLGTKAKYREEDAKLRAEIAEMLKGDGWDTTTARKFASWDPYDQNASASFFDPEWMFGLTGGFDIVIGNPPYLFITKVDKETRRLYCEHFKTADYRFDVYGLFIEMAVTSLLCQKGILSFIIPHTLLSNDSYEKLRRFLLTETMLLQVIDIGPDVFPGAKNETMVFLLSKDTDKRKCSQTRVMKTTARRFPENILEFKTAQQVWLKNSRATWLLNDASGETSVDTKMDRSPLRLGDLCTINQGLRTGDNDKYLSTEKRSEKWKPAAGGKEVARYGPLPSGLWVYYEPNVLDAPRRPEIFESEEKIVVQEIRNITLRQRIVATYDRGKFFCLQSTNVINLRKSKQKVELRYLLAILSSTAVNYYFRQRFPGNNHIPSNQLAQIPIPASEKTAQAELVRLVDRILAAKRSDPAAVTSALEREIDQEVYRLYGLTPNEIKVVEGSSHE
jgi:adenine-specific DNA-methyltransferase